MVWHCPLYVCIPLSVWCHCMWQNYSSPSMFIYESSNNSQFFKFLGLRVVHYFCKHDVYAYATVFVKFTCSRVIHREHGRSLLMVVTFVGRELTCVYNFSICTTNTNLSSAGTCPNSPFWKACPEIWRSYYHEKMEKLLFKYLSKPRVVQSESVELVSTQLVRICLFVVPFM